jgi:hypothetical protein
MKQAGPRGPACFIISAAVCGRTCEPAFTRDLKDGASSGLIPEPVSVPPRLLGLIHGDIGIFQEDTFIHPVIGIDGDADNRM